MLGNKSRGKEVALVLGHRLHGAHTRHSLLVDMIVILVTLRVVIHIGVNTPFAYLSIVICIHEQGIGIFVFDVALRLQVILLHAIAQHVFLHLKPVAVFQPYTSLQLHSNEVVIVKLPVDSGVEEHTRKFLVGLGISGLGMGNN